MNYLTNYYKNLSEQLQHRAFYLERQVKAINEAMSTYNSIGMSSNRRPTAAADSYVPRTNIPGDYNGDGRVDGADLGLGLGAGQNASTVIGNWGGMYGQPSAPVYAQPSSSGRKNRLSAAGQADGNVSGSGDEGPDLNNDGVVNGADLGLALGSGYDQNTVINNWSSPMYNAGMAAYNATTPSTGKNKLRLAQADDTGSAQSSSTSYAAGPADGPASAGNYPYVAGTDDGPASAGNYPYVAGPADGPASAGNAPYVAAQADNAATQTQNLPPLTDLNGDGVISGSDLGLYMILYNAVPPNFNTPQGAPAPGPGSYTPRTSPSYYTTGRKSTQRRKN